MELLQKENEKLTASNVALTTALKELTELNSEYKKEIERLDVFAKDPVDTDPEQKIGPVEEGAVDPKFDPVKPISNYSFINRMKQKYFSNPRRMLSMVDIKDFDDLAKSWSLTFNWYADDYASIITVQGYGMKKTCTLSITQKISECLEVLFGLSIYKRIIDVTNCRPLPCAYFIMGMDDKIYLYLHLEMDIKYFLFQIDPKLYIDSPRNMKIIEDSMAERYKIYKKKLSD